MHDPTIDRTTNGSGDVADLTYSELSAFDAGARFTADGGTSFPYRDKGHRIPSFDEVLEAFPDTPTLIEIKTANAAVAVRRSIEAHRAEERTVVDSMDGLALQVFADSKIPVGASRNDVLRVMTVVLLHLPLTPFAFRALCVPPSHYGIPIPLRSFAKVAPSQNCVIHVWTINDPSAATQLWLDGIQGIISDDPGEMLRARMLLPR
jgi:glycerophosphoryl diester phosphodiesterase